MGTPRILIILEYGHKYEHNQFANQLAISIFQKVTFHPSRTKSQGKQESTMARKFLACAIVLAGLVYALHSSSSVEGLFFNRICSREKIERLERQVAQLAEMMRDMMQNISNILRNAPKNNNNAVTWPPSPTPTSNEDPNRRMRDMMERPN